MKELLRQNLNWTALMQFLFKNFHFDQILPLVDHRSVQSHYACDYLQKSKVKIKFILFYFVQNREPKKMIMVTPAMTSNMTMTTMV